jgi:hypothetical protein
MMWQHYRNTFWRIQLIIWVVTACVYLFLGQMVGRAAIFFVFMQVSAVIGAVWGVRLRAYVDRSANKLPLTGRGL